MLRLRRAELESAVHESRARLARVEAAETALSLDRQDPFNWRKRAYCRFLQKDLEAATKSTVDAIDDTLKRKEAELLEV